MTQKLRVLVVDDSAFNRRTIAEVLEQLADVEVVGKAADGDDALRQAASLMPDLITLDLEMPRMDGFTFLRLLMARRPTPVIVVSGNSHKDSVFRALELGAIDFVSKPSRTLTSDLSSIHKELAEKVSMVRQLTPAGLEHARRGAKPHRIPAGPAEAAILPLEGTPTPVPKSALATRPATRVVAIGASTGGPSALLELLMRMPSSVDACFVIAQHMPERFTRTFAERLDRLCAMHVREANDGAPLNAGATLLCPGGQCIEIDGRQGAFVAKVVAPRSTDRYIPSVDRLFETASAVVGARLTAVVLTGMGDDGSRGVVAVKGAGGVVLAESEESAVVHGMPGAAVRTGSVDKTLSLRELADHLANTFAVQRE